ncbi:MAG: RNA-binding protein [Ktedonobacteraceae bacterium]|nr:RNA-binding protein [Ktedonobacteraceae bacterium]
MKLYVGRLPYQTTDQDLSDLFGQYGQVLSATVIVDRETGRSKGFGFVEMNDQEAQAAMSQLNNSTLEGRTIIVNEAQDRREPRSGGGGGGNFQRRDRRPGGGGSSDRRY